MEDNNTTKNKRKILAKINNEVDEFHPLLGIIFPRLPRINNTEYTHGVYEKGADFVLQRIDDTINDIEYIGIIVKIGPIKASLTKIYDQIDDCDSERIILNGKKKIRLDEIWIITNEHITNRAKEKINEKFSTRKIKFIDRDIIIKWIDNFVASYWSKVPLEIGIYLDDIKKEMIELDSSYSLLPTNIKPFYINIDLRIIEQNYTSRRRKKRKNKYFDIMHLIESQDATIIEGGPGSGKSQMVRNAVKHYADHEEFVLNNILPIYTSYQDFKYKYNEEISELINFKTKKLNINKYKDKKILTIVAFIDGFDETIDLERDSENEIQSLIEELWKIDNTKLVLTTRPIDIIDYQAVLTSNTPAYEIVPFNHQKIINFFEKICLQIKITNRLLEDIKKSDLFKQLPRNPISAILLARLVNENSKDLPANLTDIYNKYTELMLGRWDIDKGLTSDKEYEASKNILAYIAKYFIENDLSSISSKEALDHFSNYLDERNMEISTNDIFNKVTSRSGIL